MSKANRKSSLASSIVNPSFHKETLMPAETATKPASKSSQVAKPSAKPGTPDPKAKKEKKEKKSRLEHPLVGSEDPNAYPFKSVPKDFEFGKMKPLSKADFEETATFWEFKAQLAEHAAKAFRQRALEERDLGSAAERAAAKKLKKVASQMQELRKLLESKGHNVDDLLAGLS